MHNQVELFRQFYRTFPIANVLHSQLSWTQYRLLMRLHAEEQREFYIAETVKNNWTSRQLERQVYSNLYERLLLSNDKESVLAIAKNEKQPSDACKAMFQEKRLIFSLVTYDLLASIRQSVVNR